jgi:putative toxin-antitoxin system antitoxin component (TIGR02293 family)
MAQDPVMTTATAPKRRTKAPQTKPAPVVRDSATGQFFVGIGKLEELRERGFSNDEIFRIVGPRRSLARRRSGSGALTGPESDRALRLERVALTAERVFGDHDKAQRWLRKKSRVLEDAPINLLQSETGAMLVEEELSRIDHGVFA